MSFVSSPFTSTYDYKVYDIFKIYVVYVNFKNIQEYPVCPYILKQKDQAPYYLHHSFQRLNTSHMLYNNLPFKQLLTLTPFTMVVTRLFSSM